MIRLFSRSAITVQPYGIAKPKQRDDVIDAASYWIKECDIDGWRLDVDSFIWKGICGIKDDPKRQRQENEVQI